MARAAPARALGSNRPRPLSGLLDLILNLVKMVMQAFTGDWAGVWETFKQTVVGVAGSIWTAIVNLLNWIAGLFGSSLVQIGATWSGVWDAMKLTVSLVWQQIVDFFTDAWANFVNTWKGDLDAFKTMISLIGTDLYKIGQDIITGLWNGLKNEWESVKKWWQDTVQSFIDGAKSILDGHSPSREFEKIGESITDGLVLGLGKNIQVPVNMIGNLGTSMIGAMSETSNPSTVNAPNVQVYIQGSDPQAVVNKLMQTFQLQGIRFNLAGG